ncbi:hypothetical protein ACOMHN_056815 [Nucella lapillus]
MGALCSCCDDPNNETSPLLSGGAPGKPITSTQHVPSYSQKQHGVTADPAGATPPSVLSPPPPESARQNRPPDFEEEKEFLSSLDQVAAATVHQLPPELSAQNKTFQDHAKLYNELNNHFKELRQSLNDFKAKFLQDTAGIPVLADCLHILAQRCGEAQLKAKRESKHCIQLEYDRREVSEKCTGPPPEDTLEALDLYNRINRLVKAILERAPQVSRSLKIVLDDEHDLKKEVTKCDFPPDQGPDVLRHCSENLTRLRKLPTFIGTIQTYTNRIFKEILEGSKVLLSQDGGEGGGSDGSAV